MSTENNILNTSFPKEDPYHAINMPVYINAAFEFESAEAISNAFRGVDASHTYTRTSNPTIEFFEKRIQDASGAKHVTALASGMAAISNTFFCIAASGMNIVTSPKLFGNTYSFFVRTMQEFGVEIRFCNILNLEEVEQNTDRMTCAIFAESVANPLLEVIDLKKLSALAKKKGVPLVVDSTLIPWTACKPGEWGVDIEIVSSTKYISGGATSIGGLILDYGTYDWSQSPKLKDLAQKFGFDTFKTKLKSEVFRNIGACMAPQTAHLQNLGLETLDLRYYKASATANKLAHFLEARPEFPGVNYPGLKSNPFYAIAKEQFGDCPGAMLSFTMKDKASCFRFINQLKVIRRATNLFDNKSLIIHPESTIYVGLDETQKAFVGIADNLIRLSVGLEDVETLIQDISEALK